MSIVKGIQYMHNRRVGFFAALIVATLLVSTAFAADSGSAPRMSTDELKSRLGEPGLVVLDSRSNRDWESAAEKIVGAVRVNPAEVEQWSGNFDKEKTLVIYCA